jgi:hypothetical protein
MARRTDSGADGGIGIGSVLPDVTSVVARGWPGAPLDVLEVIVKFDGLVNPPGPLGLGALPFNPYLHGPSPVYGSVEFDVDDDMNTGGELGSAARFTYLANLARFGEVPTGALSSRAAAEGTDVDSSFNTGPQFERSGADFALVLCGCFDVTVTDAFGDANGRFDAGDTWIVSGRFFQRAGGYEEASAAYGGSFFGLYDPITTLKFSHNAVKNVTTVTLRFPLTMVGASILTGQPAQYADLDVSNHVSVMEALDDVIVGAGSGLVGPAKVLAQGWAGLEPYECLDPSGWRLTAIFGSTYDRNDAKGALYVWTDAAGDHLKGDFDGSGVVDSVDLNHIDSTIAALDGGPMDADGIVNGAVQVPNFGPGFSVCDVNGNGTINALDRALLAPTLLYGDANHDCVVNFADLTFVLTNWGFASAPGSGGSGDANDDGMVNFADITAALTGWGSACP